MEKYESKNSNELKFSFLCTNQLQRLSEHGGTSSDYFNFKQTKMTSKKTHLPNCNSPILMLQ